MNMLFPLTALVLAAPALAATPAADLAQVSAHLKAVRSMTADFAQTDRSGRTVNGTVALLRPGRIRFQYQKGVPLLIVGDGKALTMIDYSVRQVSRWPVMNSPLGVLLDPSRDLARFAKVVPAPGPQLLFVAARDPKRPEFGTTTLFFQRSAAAPAGLMLLGWETLDAQGNRTSVRLSHARFNVPVPEETFRWVDPRRSGPRG